MEHPCPEALNLTREFYMDTREHPQSHSCLQGGCAHPQSCAGLKDRGWYLGLLCFVQGMSQARLGVQHLSFQRCLLGSSNLLGVLLQGQGHGGAPSVSRDTWTVARWPGNEAAFDVSHGNCAYRELEEHISVLYAR